MVCAGLRLRAQTATPIAATMSTTTALTIAQVALDRLRAGGLRLPFMTWDCAAVSAAPRYGSVDRVGVAARAGRRPVG